MSSDHPNAGPSPETRAVPEGEGGKFLLWALDERLPGAREHADATASYAFATAAELGIGRDHSLLVREAARLHEVGKLYVPEPLLRRPRADLSPQQLARIEAHATAGARVARSAGLPDEACEWILGAGERFDSGAEPALPARIIAAACAYDTLLRETSQDRGAAQRWALIRVIEEAGGRLDPMAVDGLARVVERAAGRIAGS
jgi:HD-GYP domain-containing protein (c-di-GMP phosphodiesterase class II)